MLDEARPTHEASPQGGVRPPESDLARTSPLDPALRGLVAAALGAFIVLMVQHAWVTEDAYITLRTVDNLVSGFGLTWNVGERVQAFTHPLWMFVLAGFYAVTHEAYLTTVAVSAAVSVAALWVLGFRVARAPIAGFVAIMALCFARYFIDFSTSGLENPLTHLLFGLFAWLLARGPMSRASVFGLAALGGLMSLNRLDTTLLYAPALAYAIVRAHRAGIGLRPMSVTVLLAFAPLIAWEIFSVIYYGFPFPNTAYAKLGTGIAGWQAAAQGLLYLLDSAMRDPAMIALLLGSIGLVATTREPVPSAIVAGVLLYVVYVVRVGGDFMAGRFLTAPLYAAIAAVLSSRIAAPPAWGSLLLVIPALVFSVASVGLVVTPSERGVAPNGVADERQFYLDTLALAKVTRNQADPESGWLRDGQRSRTQASRAGARHVVTTVNVGLTGYGAGPMVHIVDRLALADPLLARLPAKREVNWRIGHFSRVMPHRYIESVSSGRCEFGDRDLCRYWQHLRRITEGPVWSSARFLTILKMNLGMYDHLIDADRYRNPDLVRVAHDRVARRRTWGDPTEDESLVHLKSSGAEVRFDRVRHDARVSIAVSADDGFEIVFLREGSVLGDRLVEPRFGGGLMIRSLRVPEGAAEAGYDRIRLYPYRGDGRAQLGHVRF